MSRLLAIFAMSILSISLQMNKSKSAPELLWTDCPNTTMFTNNSQYETNLNTLFHYLTANATNPSGYHQAVVSTSNTTTTDTIYGQFLCRGDQNTSSCLDCATTATTTDLPKTQCPNRKEAMLWYNQCLVKYSNESFFGSMDESGAVVSWTPYNIIGSKTRFMDLMTNMMMNEIAVRAASGDSLKKFSTGFVNYSRVQTIYGLGQCTPDLSPNDCYTCLGNAVGKFNKYQGGRVVQRNCIVQYDVNPFFDLSLLPPPPPPPSPSPSPPPPLSSPPSRGTEGNTTKLVIITVSTIVTIALVFSISFLYIKKKVWRKVSWKPYQRKDEEDEESKNLVSLQYGFDTIRVATNNFSDATILGRGGFGKVYKGRLANGQDVAIKRLSMDSGQGDAEFKTEVLLLAKLQHKNLIRLLGFCSERRERILVYEFVPNTSLDHFLFDVSKRSNLYWSSRYKIILGIARGLLYLHEESRLRIIHRDLKASNILLDDELNPKIADFGTARLFEIDQTQGDTNKVVGTYGYMAPEYVLHGLYSVKSDVYSFGVLVLEIITGRKNITFHDEGCAEDLLSYVWRNWREDRVLNIMDPTLLRGSNTEIIRSIHMGLLCVQESTEDRPTMSSVVLMLSSHSLTFPAPSRPAFVSASTTNYIHPKERSEDSITDVYAQ